MKKVVFIENLKFSFGSCFGPSMITLQGKNVSFCQDLYYNLENNQRTVSDESINSLISELNSLGILNWDKEYFNPNILDGDQWDLEMVYNKGKKKTITGCNRYPGSQSDSNETTPEFKKLLNALNNLIKTSLFSI
jgi:hypothetical protein